MKKQLVIAVLLTGLVSSPAVAQTQIGFQAELSNLSTVGISGTVTITGPTTIRFDNFNYDGRGGGLTNLRLLPDADAATLGNNFGPGYRNTQIFNNGIDVANLRGEDPSVAGDVPPFVNFSGEIDLLDFDQTGTFSDGLSLTDVAGISVFCVPQQVDFGSGIFTSPADFNNDGIVNTADYGVWRESLGATGLTAGQLGDANSDGAVTLEDYDLFVEALGTVAAAADPNTSALLEELTDHGPPAAIGSIDPASVDGSITTVPEPASAVLITLAVASLVGRRVA